MDEVRSGERVPLLANEQRRSQAIPTLVNGSAEAKGRSDERCRDILFRHTSENTAFPGSRSTCPAHALELIVLRTVG